MNTLICIDDTDNLETRGTGQLAQLMASEIRHNGWGRCSGITRHQLFVHDDIPYTSHNSAMCFEAEIDDRHLNTIIDFGQRFLEKESASGSDPGFCVAAADRLPDHNELIHFGCQAKKTVLTKDKAFAMADRLGIHLTEHGGTGDGVIGALAGIGLRLTGNDGRIRGWFEFDAPDQVLTVGQICSRERIDAVKTRSGKVLGQDVKIVIEDKVKSVLQDGRAVVLVTPIDGKADCGIEWQTLSRKQIKAY